MAQPSLNLILAIRKTATKLESGTAYQWGHMGSCNCGNLAQELTSFSRAEIHARAMERPGDWTQQCHDYCPDSGLRMDEIIEILLESGLDLGDLKDLEKLSDRKILARIQKRGLGDLRHNHREDVIEYLSTWANLLEEELLNSIKLNLDVNDLQVESGNIPVLDSSSG